MAFITVIIEACVETALAMRLKAKEELTFTLEVLAGTSTFLSETVHPRALKWQATSGRTTVAGLYILEGKGLHSALKQAFLATYRRNPNLEKNLRRRISRILSICRSRRAIIPLGVLSPKPSSDS